MKCVNLPNLLRMIGVALIAFAPASADAAPSVRINNLADVAFGTISNFTSDQTSSQSICIYSTAAGGLYQITATGSGSGGAFTLASGTDTMAYEVQWAATAGQTTGTSLTAGVALTGLTSNATKSGCTSGPSSSASLITVLRTAEIGAAKSGSYSGTMTLLVAPN